MFRKLLFLIIILLFIPICFSAETIIFSESFDYSDLFANHGWAFSRSWASIPNTPVDFTSPQMSPNAFGWNQSITTGGAVGTLADMFRSLPINITSGTFSMSYDIDIINTTEIDTIMSSVLTDSFIRVQVLFDIEHRGNGVTDIENDFGGENCNSSNTFNFTDRFRATTIIQFDINNNLYNVFYLINGTEFQSIGCEGKTLHNGSFGQFDRIQFKQRWQQDTNQTKYLDNIIVGTEFIALDIFSIGQPCDSDSDCFSGNCEYGFCAYQLARGFCDSDSDCLSGNCVNNKCTQASLWESMEASKNQQFGDDSNTNNFISLFFMIGLPFLIILAGRSKTAVLGGIVVYFGLAFFFTVVGWLSPFILLGSIISGLILFVLVMMLGASSD